MWRVQVRLSPRAALITLELVHTMETGRWRLLRATTETGGGVIDLPLRRQEALAQQAAGPSGVEDRIGELRALDSAS